MPSTPFIGVRISWLIAARNSDLVWFDDSALARAARSSWLARASEAVRSATRRSSSSFSSASRRSAALRSATSCASRALFCSSCRGLGTASSFGISGQSATAVVSETAAVPTLSARLDAVVGHPHRPDAEEVGDAAGDDEGPEQVEDPAVGDVPPPIGEVDDRQRDREVGQRDHRIRDQMRPEHVGPPEQAHPVRLKALGRQEIPDPARQRPLPPGTRSGLIQF